MIYTKGYISKNCNSTATNLQTHISDHQPNITLKPNLLRKAISAQAFPIHFSECRNARKYLNPPHFIGPRKQNRDSRVVDAGIRVTQKTAPSLRRQPTYSARSWWISNILFRARMTTTRRRCAKLNSTANSSAGGRGSSSRLKWNVVPEQSARSKWPFVMTGSRRGEGRGYSQQETRGIPWNNNEEF